MIRNPQQAALDFAARIDRTFREHPDDYLIEHARIEIAELLDGEGVDGFRADLVRRLADIRQDLLDEAEPMDRPGGYLSQQLQHQIEAAQDDAARGWLQAAQRIMAPHEAAHVLEKAA